MKAAKKDAKAAALAPAEKAMKAKAMKVAKVKAAFKAMEAALKEAKAAALAPAKKAIKATATKAAKMKAAKKAMKTKAMKSKAMQEPPPWDPDIVSKMGPNMPIRVSPDWWMAYAPSGHPYYRNSKTSETTWTKPWSFYEQSNS